MSTENIVTLVSALFVSISGVLILIKMLTKKADSLEQKYFYKFLKNIVNCKIRDNDELEKYISELIHRNKFFEIEYIPPYIKYIVSIGKYEDLYKVIIFDYWYLFPNDNKLRQDLMEKTNKMIFLFIPFAFLFAIFEGFAKEFTNLLNSSYNNIGLVIHFISIIIAVLICLFFSVCYIWVNGKMLTDRYAISIKMINKQITKKVKCYNKPHYFSKNNIEQLYYINGCSIN